MTNTILSFSMHGNWHASMLPATRSHFSHDINIMNENSIFSITFSFSHHFIPQEVTELSFNRILHNMIHIIYNFIYYPNSAIRVYTTVVFNTMKNNAWSRFLSAGNFIYRNAFIINTNRANAKFNTSHTILAVKFKEDYMLRPEGGRGVKNALF